MSIHCMYFSLFNNRFIFGYFPSTVLYLFVRMSENTNAVQNFGAFLNKLFAGNLISLKREVDGYIVSWNFGSFLNEDHVSSRVIFVHELMNIVRQKLVELEYYHSSIIFQ